MPSDHFKYRGSDIYLEDDITGSSLNIEKGTRSLIFNYPCSSSITCTPYVITLPRGQYLLQAFGASGGNSRGYELGGLGGFSEGLFLTKEATKLYLYIGGKGNDFNEGQVHSKGGYNGGGTSYGDCGGGGGATDFRTVGDTINSPNSYKSRILIAGGGGGGRTMLSGQDIPQAFGGSGGGKNATQGESLNTYKPCYGSDSKCTGGTSDEKNVNGVEWKGADAEAWGAGLGGGGGGGGYFGGGTCASCAGSGGSG